MEIDRSVGRNGAVGLANRGMDKQRILSGSPFGALMGATREALLDLGAVERLPKRYAVAVEGAPLRSFLLLGSGRVKLERVRDDRVLPLGHRGPGQMVGESALGPTAVATESAVVLDEVEALAIPIPAFRETLAGDPLLQAALAAALVHQHRALQARLELLLLRSVEVRLLAFLLEALDRWGRPHTDGHVIAAPFTHADIAWLIGSTRETVTLTLGKLKREGQLAFDRRRIVIRDRAKLSQSVAD